MRASAAALLALTSLAATSAFPDPRGGASARRAARSCADLGVHFDGRPVVRDEQKLTVSAAEAAPLRLRPGGNGGVVVWGGPGPDYALSVCRIAVAGPGADGQAVLRQISATVSGGQVSVSGPRGRDWTAFLLVSAPTGARLDIEVENGPLSFDDVDGSVAARSSNGPVSLEGVSGSVEVTTQNGPISVEDGSGDYKLRADNGPLSLELSGDHWDGHFEASTQNGPLSVELRPSFASGLRVETSPWAPASCRAAVCAGARWEKLGRTRVLEVGSGSPSVSLSTVNGPLSISNTGS